MGFGNVKWCDVMISVVHACMDDGIYIYIYMMYIAGGGCGTYRLRCVYHET